MWFNTNNYLGIYSPNSALSITGKAGLNCGLNKVSWVYIKLNLQIDVYTFRICASTVSLWNIPSHNLSLFWSNLSFIENITPKHKLLFFVFNKDYVFLEKGHEWTTVFIYLHKPFRKFSCSITMKWAWNSNSNSPNLFFLINYNSSTAINKVIKYILKCRGTKIFF